MTHPIRTAAVLGAGTMGAQIAAHFANAGVPVLLLDVTAAVARDGLKRARGLKPDPFFTANSLARITTGGFDTDLAKLKDADWIMEAVVEQLDIKRALLERVDAVRAAGHHRVVEYLRDSDRHARGRDAATTSGGIGSARTFSTRRATCASSKSSRPGTPIPRWSSACRGSAITVSARASWSRRTRRISSPITSASTACCRCLKALESGRYTIEEIDAITGPALGRPRSATFRTMDIAGVDILAHVASNLGFELPAFVTKMIEKGLVGEKAGQGIYKRIKTKDGSEILTLDPATLTYRPKQSARLPSIDAARSIDDTGARIKALLQGKDKVGDFLRETLEPTLRYTVEVTPDIAYSADDVDRVMRWGFGWELGPFEIMKAIGMDTAVRRPASWREGFSRTA